MTTSTTFTSSAQVSSFKAKTKSGELRIIQNGEYLQVIGINGSNVIEIDESGTLGKYANSANGNVAALAPWTSTTVAADPNDSSLKFQSQKRLGAVVVKGVTLVFWVDTQSGNYLYVTRKTPGVARTPEDWCAVLVPSVNQDGSPGPGVPVSVASAGICATAGVGAGEIIVSYLTAQTNVLSVAQLNLNYADYDMGQNTWLASSAPWQLQTLIPATTSTTLANYDVRCIVAEVPDQQGAGIFEFGVIWDGGSHTIYSYAWQLAADGKARNSNRPGPIKLTWSGSSESQAGDGPALSIDPAGRLLATFGLASPTYNLGAALIGDLGDLLSPGVTQLGWTAYPISPQVKSVGPISTLFCVGRKQAKPVTIPASFPVTLALFWLSNDSNANVQSASTRYALAQTSGTVSTIPDSDPNSKKCFVTSICDPFPMPQPPPQIWNNATPDGMADWLLFEYAFLNGHSRTRVFDANFRLGVSASMDFKNPFYDATAGFSIEGGGIVNKNDVTSAYTAQGMKVQTKAYFHPLADQGTPGPYAVRPYGAYTAKTALSLVSITYTLSSLAFSSDGAGSTFTARSYSASVNEENVDTITGDYFTYAVTPGDVSSYTESAINQRMKYLYETMTSGMTEAQIAQIFSYRNKDGALVDLTKYYTNGNYVGDVIRDFGVVLDVGDYDQEFKFSKNSGSLMSKAKAGKKYVSYALSGSSVSDGTFMVKKGESFGYGGYLNLELYGGFELEDFGEAPFENKSQLAGFELRFKFQMEIMTTETDERTTAISMNVYYNPLASTQSLAARLYALRPSPLWAIELQYFPEIARGEYLAGLKQTLAAAAPPLTVTPAEVDSNPSLKGVLSNSESLLLNQSIPARYLLVVTNWDPASYQVTPPYQITTHYSADESTLTQRNLPTSPIYFNTGNTTTSTDPNYAINETPAVIMQSLPNTYVAAPAGSAWITAQPIAGVSMDNQDFDYATTVYLNDGLFESQSPFFSALVGDCAADDSCQIFVNGELVTDPWGTGQPVAATAMYGSTYRFMLPRAYLRPGENTIIFRVHNVGGPTGLLVANLGLSRINPK